MASIMSAHSPLAKASYMPKYKKDEAEKYSLCISFLWLL